jgi:hypothetical protein
MNEISTELQKDFTNPMVAILWSQPAGFFYGIVLSGKLPQNELHGSSRGIFYAAKKLLRGNA